MFLFSDRLECTPSTKFERKRIMNPTSVKPSASLWTQVLGRFAKQRIFLIAPLCFEVEPKLLAGRRGES